MKGRIGNDDGDHVTARAAARAGDVRGHRQRCFLGVGVGSRDIESAARVGRDGSGGGGDGVVINVRGGRSDRGRAAGIIDVHGDGVVSGVRIGV